jgi:hypothetical protein
VDTVTLVERRTDDGRKLIELLTQKDIDVTAAAWVLTSEEGNWFLYIATQEVDKGGQAAAYAKVYSVLRSMAGTCISTSDVKLISKKNPITRDILRFASQLTDSPFARYRDRLLGSIGVEEVYIYPQYESLRQSYTISYVRQDRTNRWQARTTPGELYRNTRAKGAVGYSTARREGETEEDERHATVAVLLEIGPQFDDKSILSDPNVRRVMFAQAQIEADEMFKSHHPNATIEHIDYELLQASLISKAETRQPKAKVEALFVGGPYDGMSLSLEQITTYGIVTPVSSQRGIRLFVLLPPVDVWARLVKGEITKERSFEILYCYERKLIPGAAEFHYGSEDTISQALAQQ